jgi:hypothetical protein
VPTLAGPRLLCRISPARPVEGLPALGIRGNTDFPMSDLNNLQIADLPSTFLADKTLD